MADTTPLAEQQRILRAALDVMRLRESPDDDPTEWARERDGVIEWLELSITAHDQTGAAGCVVEPGQDCEAVEYARKVIEGRA